MRSAAPETPSRESSFSKDYHSLFDSSSDEAEEEGLSPNPKRSPTISMHGRSAIKLLNCKAILRLPRRCVLLAPHRIPLKEFTSLRKKPKDRGGLFPMWGYPWVQPETTTTQSQTEDLFWRW
ncbi:ATP-binding cassette (ABC) Superfamily, partial [Phytophthora palmivora]